MSIYKEATARILAAMEASVGKVESPWVGPAAGRPVNAVTGKVYQGVNVPLLWSSARIGGFPTNEWATYRQWHQVGGQVRKGQKATPIVFFKRVTRVEIDEETGEEKKRDFPIIRQAFVFNRDQIDGVEHQRPGEPPAAIEDLDLFVQKTGARVEVGGARSCYLHDRDLILMPNRRLFTGTTTSDSTESWYAVLLHELTHWTGHKFRLNRKMGNRFGSEAYAFEELIAELGSAFLCADLGICNTVRKDHADYLKNWISILKGDDRAFFVAAAEAEKAAKYIHQLQAVDQAA